MNGASSRFSIVLTEDEINLLAMGLETRACYIETGTPTLRAGELGPGPSLECGAQIRPLSVDQMRLLVATDDLLKRLRSLK